MQLNGALPVRDFRNTVFLCQCIIISAGMNCQQPYSSRIHTPHRACDNRSFLFTSQMPLDFYLRDDPAKRPSVFCSTHQELNWIRGCQVSPSKSPLPIVFVLMVSGNHVLRRPSRGSKAYFKIHRSISCAHSSPDGDVVRLSRTILYVGTVVKGFFCRTTHLSDFLYIMCPDRFSFTAFLQSGLRRTSPNQSPISCISSSCHHPNPCLSTTLKFREGRASWRVLRSIPARP